MRGCVDLCFDSRIVYNILTPHFLTGIPKPSQSNIIISQHNIFIYDMLFKRGSKAAKLLLAKHPDMMAE